MKVIRSLQKAAHAGKMQRSSIAVAHAHAAATGADRNGSNDGTNVTN